jgi:hypothetical protein
MRPTQCLIWYWMQWFLGIFAKLQKATSSLSSRPSVCLSALNNLAPTQRTFFKFEYFSKICRGNSSLIESEKKNGYFRRRLIYIFYQSRSFLLRKRNVSDKVVEKKSKHVLCSTNFNFSNIVPFFRQSRKIWYSRTGHRWLYGACALHAGYLRLQTHSQNI